MTAKSFSFLIVATIISMASCSDSLEVDVTALDKTTAVFPKSYSERSYDIATVALDRNHPAVINMRKRALLIGTIPWTPLNDVPRMDNYYFTAGQSYTGIPYSSVKELDKFVGQEVSFHTFLTAVHNPKSVLYSERVDYSPYSGINCAAYYGTVCSMAVNYALGLERPYFANSYGSLPIFQRVSVQDFAYCAPGDVIWRDGHVALITDVEKDDTDQIDYIEVLESIGIGTSIRKYSIDDLYSRWKGTKWILYRYKELENTLSNDATLFPINEGFVSDITYNDYLCLDRGDKVCYRKGETVKVNIFPSSYTSIMLFREGELLSTQSCTCPSDICYNSLSAGQYEVRLTDGSSISPPVLFEVLDINVSINKSGNIITLNFSSDNAEAEYIVFCSKRGERFFISDITDADRSCGFKKIYCEHSIVGLYAKIFFKGQYGRVSNEIIPLFL